MERAESLEDIKNNGTIVSLLALQVICFLIATTYKSSILYKATFIPTLFIATLVQGLIMANIIGADDLMKLEKLPDYLIAALGIIFILNFQKLLLQNISCRAPTNEEILQEHEEELENALKCAEKDFINEIKIKPLIFDPYEMSVDLIKRFLLQNYGTGMDVNLLDAIVDKMLVFKQICEKNAQALHRTSNYLLLMLEKLVTINQSANADFEGLRKRTPPLCIEDFQAFIQTLRLFSTELQGLHDRVVTNTRKLIKFHKLLETPLPSLVTKIASVDYNTNPALLEFQLAHLKVLCDNLRKNTALLGQSTIHIQACYIVNTGALYAKNVNKEALDSVGLIATDLDTCLQNIERELLPQQVGV